MTKIKFKNKKFEVGGVQYATYDNRYINVIIYADSDTLESIAEFAKGPYIIQEFDGIATALYSSLEPFEVYDVDDFISSCYTLDYLGSDYYKSIK